MDLFIVVINYRQEELTIRFVKNELSKMQLPHKTIIVNNSATIGSNHLLCNELNAMLVEDINAETDTKRDTFVISSIDNLGFARGNNLGAGLYDVSAVRAGAEPRQPLCHVHCCCHLCGCLRLVPDMVT